MKASDIIAEAEKYIGYRGKAKSTDNLDAIDSPNGAGEYNRFSRDCYNAGYFNGNKNGYDGWCTSFVIAMFLYLAGSKTEADKVCPTSSNSAGCDWFAGVFTARAIDGFFPKVGDVGFALDSEGNSVHCFIVKSIDSHNLLMKTIEANTKDENGNDDIVCEKTRLLKGKSARYYFGHPLYESEEVVTDNTLLAEYSVKLAKAEEELNLTKIKLEKSENELTTLKEKGQNLKNAVTAFMSLT